MQTFMKQLDTSNRKKYLSANPLLKWCNRGKHFTLRLNFSKLSKSADGLQSTCKLCLNKYREENKNIILQRKREYRQNNQEKINQSQKIRYENDKSYFLTRSAIYRRNNKEKIKGRGVQYYQANKDRLKKKSRLFYHQNKDRATQTQKAYYRANKELYTVRSNARKSRLKAAKGGYTLQEWKNKLDVWGYRCYLCLESLIGKTIHIEHRIPISRGGTNWIANIAPACAECNLSKNNKTEKEFREWKRNLI